MKNSTLSVPKALIKKGLVGIFFLSAIQVLVAQSGPNYAGSAVNSNVSNSELWSDASEATGSANDNDYASVGLSCNNKSDFLKATNFGFSIPGGSTVTGVQVVVEWYKTGSDIEDYEVFLVKGGSISSTGNKATATNLPSSEGTNSYGSSTDLWSQTLSATDINNSGFGVAIRVNRSGSGNSNKYVMIDRISIQVFHSIDCSAQIAALAAQVTTNTGNIADNTSDITDNTADISDLQTGVNSNTAAISASNAAIAVNTSDISDLQTDLATTSSATAANSASIAANSADIAANSSDISDLQTEVADQSTDITANTTAIAANTAAITSNSASIAANSADIAANSSDISDLQTEVADQTADISANTAAIAANTAAIAADEDGDETNELNSVAILSGKKLDITDAGGTLSADLGILANEDTDGDTKVHFEKNTDEDIIRFDLNGTEKWVMKGSNLSPKNSGGSIFIGENAGSNDLLTNNNTFIGPFAGAQNTTGNFNVFMGYEAGNDNTSGARNVYIGHQAGENGTTAYANTMIGWNAGHNISNASYNTFYGEDAGFNTNSGTLNSFTGYRSGYNNTDGHYNTAIGTSAGFNGTTWMNRTAIGFSAQNTASNQVRIGNSSVSSIGGFAGWTNVSDARFKTNVTENVLGMDFIMKLRPVTYNLDMNAIAEKLGTTEGERLYQSEAEKTSMLQTGFIAQEVEAAAQELGYNFSGVDAPKNESDFYGLRYAEFVVPMVKGMQEQQVVITQLSEKVKELESRPANSTGTTGTTKDESGIANCDRVKEQEMEIQDLKEEVQKLKQVISTIHPASTGIDILNTANVGLMQNQPNPFSEETVIGYTTPEGTVSANILVFNMNGVLLMSVDVSDLGTGKITIRGEQLTPGMYIYSLIANDKEIDTKRMILTE